MFLEKLINYFGVEHQKLILYEEMSELQKELIKNTRGKHNTMELIEEIADVEILLKQIKLYYRIENIVNYYKNEKISKLENDLKKYIY